jgi:NaMN:DMB phosphoribosyltransferase
LVGAAPSASTTNTVTNKIAVNIGGTVYYLLASTSGT